MHWAPALPHGEKGGGLVVLPRRRCVRGGTFLFGLVFAVSVDAYLLFAKSRFRKVGPEVGPAIPAAEAGVRRRRARGWIGCSENI